LYSPVVRRSDAAVWAAGYTGVAAYTLVPVNGYNAVFNAERAGYTALYAIRLIAVAAGNGKGNAVFFLDSDTRVDFNVLQ
jgi:hypothetical protein